MGPYRNRNYGFTLVEMAVVLVVIGLVLAGVLGTFQAQMDSAKIRETRQSLAEIKEALIAYSLSHGYLPCPANPTLANTAVGAGLEDRVVATGTRTGQCNRLNGVIPWASLGVKELDSWGGRFSYSVSDDYAPDPAPYVTTANGAVQVARATRFARNLSNSDPSPVSNVCSDSAQMPTRVTTFGLCSPAVTSQQTDGRINVFARSGGALIAQKVVAVIVSHGKNRRGSFNAAGGARIAGSLGDELWNADANTAAGGVLDDRFVSKPFVYHDNQLDTTYYDDLTEWIPVPALIGRMVSAGRLP